MKMLVPGCEIDGCITRGMSAARGIGKGRMVEKGGGRGGESEKGI
jgi:hypothetical protein